MTKKSDMLTAREYATYAALSVVVGTDLISRAREVRERVRWSRDEMQDFRLHRLRSILGHAAANIPYYARGFSDSGLDPSNLSSFGDLQVIPPLTREALVQSFAELRDPRSKPSEVQRMSTGGTTGRPVTVFLDRSSAMERMLVNHRMFAMMGRRLGDPTLLIAGSPIDAVAWTSARDYLKNRLFNVTVRSSFGLTPDTIKGLVAEMKARRYAFVIAYASVFDVLASHVESAGEELRLESIVPCAELVTQAQRERWREAFGAEIYEVYGSREMSSIGGEGPDHRGLLINEDIYHVEITDELGCCLPDGEAGLITVTSLLERGMPLIRYQLGDMGARLARVPGDAFPFARLTMTHGRVLDLISCSNGKLLPGEFFPHLMKEVAGQVERYQVVQETLDLLVIRLVAKATFDGQTTHYLEGKIRAQVGVEMRLDFQFVNAIETSSSGKYRPTISKVPWELRKIGKKQ